MTTSRRLNGQENGLLWWPAEIHAPAVQGQNPYGDRPVPTCPDTSLPWSQDAAHGGWSARMYLHQTIATSAPHWRPSDTDLLLSQQMPSRLRLKTDGVISLLRQMTPIGFDHSQDHLSLRAILGLLNRSARRHRPVFVLLRADSDMIIGIITYGKEGDCESLTVRSADGSVDTRTDGLQDYLRRLLRECTATPLSLRSPRKSSGQS